MRRSRRLLLIPAALAALALAGCGSSEPAEPPATATDAEYLDARAYKRAQLRTCEEPEIPPGVEPLRVADAQRSLRRQGAIALTFNGSCIFALAPPGGALDVPAGSTQPFVIVESEFTRREFDAAESAMVARAEAGSVPLGASIDAAVGRIVLLAPDPVGFCAPLADEFPGMFLCREGAVEALPLRRP